MFSFWFCPYQGDGSGCHARARPACARCLFSRSEHDPASAARPEPHQPEPGLVRARLPVQGRLQAEPLPGVQREVGRCTICGAGVRSAHHFLGVISVRVLRVQLIDYFGPLWEVLAALVVQE